MTTARKRLPKTSQKQNDGLISAPSQLTIFESDAALLTSLAEASLARTSALPARRPDSQEGAADCGARCGDSSGNCDQAGCSLRTFLILRLEELTQSSLRWKRSATPAGRSWWVLGPAERRTAEIESGSWPTATASDSTGSGRANYAGKGKMKTGTTLTDAAVRKRWATPVASKNQNSTRTRTPAQRLGTRGEYLSVQVQLYPTPTASQYGSNQGGRVKGEKRPSLPALAKGWNTPRARDWKGKDCLPSQLDSDKSSSPGKKVELLNPRWVLQLMGYPSDWL